MNPMFQQQETGGRLMGRMWGTFVPGVLGELGQAAPANPAIFCFFLVSPGSCPEPVALCGRSSRSKSKFGGVRNFLWTILQMTESAVALGVVGIDRLGGGVWGGGGRPEFQICRSVLAQKWAIVGSEEAKKTPQIPAKMALSSI